MDHDLERELRYHIERRVDDLIAGGLTEAGARRQAALEFGGVLQVQEEVRDTWIWRWLDTAQRDLQYAARLLRRSPGFAITALLSLALGIGASAAVFSLVDQVLLRRLPVRDPDRLVYFQWRGSSLSSNWGFSYLNSYPLCRELQQQRQVFEGVLCRHPIDVHLSTGTEGRHVRAEIVSGSYFDVLGVQPLLGRLIAVSDDERPGGHPVVVLGHKYWQNTLGGDPGVLGRNVRVSNYPMTVIGIAPAGFGGLDPLRPADVWMPAAMAEQAGNIDAYWNRLQDRRAAWLHLFGRLKPGMTVEDAEAGLEPWFRAMLQSEPATTGFPSVTAEQQQRFLSSTLNLEPTPRGLSGRRDALQRPVLVILSGTVLLLLLASLNVAGLLLARGAARAREFTTRMAVGATRRRVAAQLLTESAMLALGGGALGVLAAPVISRVLLFFLAPGGEVALTVDARVLLFALATTVLTAVWCGVAPAFQIGRIPLVASLNDRSRAGAAGGVRLRKAIVAGQLAFTLVLLVGSALFVQTLSRLQDNLGFDGRNLVTVSIDPPSVGYAEPDAERVMREVYERLQVFPAVERVAAANSTMLVGGAASSTLTIQSDRRFVADRAAARMRVGPGFFATIGTPIIAGRDFDDRDMRPLGEKPRPYRSVIVSESFARRYFPDRDPLGARIGLGSQPDTRTDIEIIGVVKDFSRRSLRDAQVETIFLNYFDNQSGDGTFYVRTRGDAASAFNAIRAAVAQVDPALPATLVVFEDQIDQSLRAERMLASLSSAFGVFALLLAVIGLYGVMAFVVTQRTAEIGVRMALGATRLSALWLVIRDAIAMVAIGMLIALPSLWGLQRFVKAQLFGVTALDVPTIVVASALLTFVGLSAAMLPAWKAATTNPVEALRV
ncbi:MAG TPA: ABC transporter permease [Vicinamibacterales bacterium]|nr:ABC transporter permease [Vicinamibacterales bacterium]